MTAEQITGFINAVEEAGLKNFELVTDMSTNLWNNESGIIKQNGDLIVAFRKAQFQTVNTVNGVEIVAADAADVHEARVIGDADKLKLVAEALGTALDDSEYKMLLGLDKRPVNLKPITGNYIVFNFLTKEQYNALSDDNKAKYDEAKKFEGDDLPSFGYINPKEYDSWNQEDKDAYDELKELYENKVKNYTGVNQAAMISLC